MSVQTDPFAKTGSGQTAAKGMHDEGSALPSCLEAV
eukprot:COSAG06_NODE_52453_length_305_cov_1.145631_1_plen_35_part_01